MSALDSIKRRTPHDKPSSATPCTFWKLTCTSMNFPSANPFQNSTIQNHKLALRVLDNYSSSFSSGIFSALKFGPRTWAHNSIRLWKLGRCYA